MSAERLFLLRFPARADRLKLVRALVSATVRACRCDEALAHDLVLAVDEACQNVVRHAYPGEAEGEAELEILHDGIMLIFRLRDFAQPVDAERLRPGEMDLDALGGRGLRIIHDVMDEVDCTAPVRGTGNQMEMRKRIGPCGQKKDESQDQS